MKLLWLTLWIASLAGAFALARWTAPAGALDAPGVETLRAALAERDPLTRARQLTASLDAFQPDELAPALAALEEERVGIAKEEVRLFMLAWSRFDAPGAFAWAQAYPSPWRKVLMEQAMYAWGFRDGAAALAACDALPDSEPRDELRRSLVSGWVESHDRLGASLYAASVPDQRRRNRLGFLLAGEAMRDGVDAVVAWAEAVPEDAANGFKRTAFYHAAGTIARRDPQRAIAWYEAHRERPYSATAPREIARKWAMQDPAAALAWLRGLPSRQQAASDAPMASDVVATAFRRWLRDDAAAARAWLEAELPDPRLDPAIAELARSLAGISSREAAEWALRIEDEEQRARSVAQAVRPWLRRDTAAARAWLAEHEISDAQLAPAPRARRSAGAGRAAAPPAGGGTR